MGLYVQYGCGLCAPEGWLNFDASPSLVMRRIPLAGRFLSSVPWPEGVRHGDIRKGLPIAAGSADGAYCSHVLEHLSLEDCRVALANTFRALKPGGVFRLVVPDLKALAQRYLSRSDGQAAIQFMQDSSLGHHSRPGGMSGLLRAWLGNSLHLWMWDYESLSGELAKAGFGSIRRAQLGDSGDPNFAKVEDAARWNEAVGIHCLRPQP